MERDKITGRFFKGCKMSEKTKTKMRGRIPWNKGKGLSYSNDEGGFLEVIGVWGRPLNGTVTEKGYRKYNILGNKYPEHKLMWTYHNGEIPEGYDIHHIDGNKLNNQLNNLEIIEHGRHSRFSSREIRR